MATDTKHPPAPLAHHFENLQQQRDAQLIGMWIFLATEMLVFGALFVGYTAYRTYYAEAFAEASRHLNALIGGGNTLILLTSSLTMALAVHAARTSRQTALVVFLGLTILLGCAFLGLKVVEYSIDYQENLIPGYAFHPEEWTARGVNPNHVGLFLSFYYIMTGVHALHMIIGVGVLLAMLYFAWRRVYWAEYYMPVEISGLYWHFVDIIWIFLLPLLYLVGTRSSLY